MEAQELDRLVARVQAGDSAAFVDILLGVQKEVRIFLSAHASSVDMVDEVLQATLVTCYENIAKYRPGGTFLSWVKGIARNLLLRELHDRSRLVTMEGDRLDEILTRRGIDGLESASDQDEMIRRLDDCIAKLDRPARDLLARRYQKKMPIGKLARLVKRTESWVAVSLFRIRESLRACLTRLETAV